MAQKITQLASLTLAASGDFIPIVDISDTSMAASGTDKKMTFANFEASLTLANQLGNIPVTKLDSGNSATSSTFWRGDGVWATPPVVSVFGRTGAITAATNDYSEAQISFTDITTNNSSTTKHGYLKKLSNSATEYMDGTGNWSTPSGGSSSPKMRMSTVFERSDRFGVTAVGAGSIVFDALGLNLLSSVTSTSSANTTWTIDLNGKVFLGSPTLSMHIYGGNLSDTANTRSSYFGLGTVSVNGSGHTYTDPHAGFKILLAGGVYSLYATQANGSTETASSALTTIVNGDNLDLILTINGTSSVDYYWRKNGGSLSSATNLTTNMPTASSSSMAQFSVSNNANANFITIDVSGASYER